MMKELKYGFFKWCVCLIIIILHTKTHAQTYPVQTNIVVVGPYYNYLNYYADENAHLQIITTLTDFNTAPVNVRLRIQFIGPGYTISTKPNAIIGQAFTLEPGIPLFINGIDLLPYFYETNVVKSPSGINLNSLPEGLTTVCVDVIRDGVSQEVLSTNNCTSFFLQRFQPPQGVFPQCGSNINPDEGFYTFQWSPPIGYVPSIGSELNYTFSLYEWNDPNNYNIFQTGQGLVYQAYIQQPIVQLSNFDLTLQNGKNYVWRVQAQLLSNGLPVNMIENNGLSGICTFTYGTAQTLEESLAEGLHIDISAMGEGERKGKASWTVIDNTPGEGLSTFSSYIVYYRKKPSGNEGYELTWFQDTVSTFNHFIYQLEPATTYEVKVAGRVGENYVSEISETKEFTTYNPRAYACGDTDMPFRSQTYQPLAQAQAGMYFQIGQFSMQVTDIMPVGAAGHYQGKGLIPIAFLAGAKAMVKFDDILVDDKYMVREGIVEVMTKGLEQWLHEQYMQFIDPIYVSGTVDSAYVENGMAWVVIDGQPQSWEFDPPDYPIIVNDDSGTQYIIHPNGTITVSTYFEILEEWEDVNANEVVTFSQSENETFGFDAKQHTQWHDNYDIIQLADSSYYFASNKSLGVGKTDVVQVNLPTGGTGTYTYKINNGAAQPLSAGPLTLPAQNTKGDFNLEVFQGTKKVGKLKLVVFEQKEINVVVVPLVSAAPAKAQLETTLNETLGEANLKFNVTIAPQWNNSTFTTSKTIQLPEEVGLLSKYSEEMKTLRNVYFEDSTALIEEDAFYVFVVPGFSDNTVDGYMVRGKGLGFVAQGATVQTYAHELGHGVGTLKHSWNDNGPEQGMTSNLMDYSENAVKLTRAQWKQIRSWSVLPSFWDEEEDAMATSGLVAYYFWEEERGGTFFNTSGTPIHTKIIDNKVVNAYKKNQKIVLMDNISVFNQENISYLKSFIVNRNSLLNKTNCSELKSVIFYKDYLGQWNSIFRDPVLYFEVKMLGNNQYEKTFLFAKDSILLLQLNSNLRYKATSHYTVKRFVNSNGTFSHYQVLDFAGKDVTSQFTSTTKNPPQRYLVFSNGYRGPAQNWYESDGLVTSTDRYNYWTENGFSKKMITRLKAEDKTYYIDGSFGIWTSNHRNMASFSWSAENIEGKYLDYLAGIDTRPYFYCSKLNDDPKVDGFNYRKNKGKLAGKVFLTKIKADPRSVGVKDTIDIVAHSMGYAYAVGFIEEIKNEVHLGRFYIFAPENACSGGNDWTQFEEVWQYGANNNEIDEDPINYSTLDGTRDPYWWQDGIAPQCAVFGIDGLPTDKTDGGRVYIPKTFSPKGFNASHYIKNYMWVFSITSNQLGYVKPR